MTNFSLVHFTSKNRKKKVISDMQYLHHKQENLLITWGNTFYYLTIHSSPQKSTVSLTSFWQAVNLIYSRSHLYVPFMEDSNFRAGAGFTRHACKDKDSTCINQETPVSFLTFIMWPNTFFFFFFFHGVWACWGVYTCPKQHATASVQE